MNRRRPLAVMIVVSLVGSAVWACVGDDPDTVASADAGSASDGSSGSDGQPDGSSADSSSDAQTDADADAPATPTTCALFADARACEDFEGDAGAWGFTPAAQDRVLKTALSPGGGGSLQALALAPTSGSGASFYQLGFDTGAPFAVRFDLRPSSANATTGTTLLDWTDVALLTANTADGKLALSFQFAGPNAIDGGRFVGTPVDVGTLPTDVWSTVEVRFAADGVTVRVGPAGRSYTRPTEIAIGSSPHRLWIGPYAPAASSFELALDNVVVE